MSWTIAEREEFDALAARVDDLENPEIAEDVDGETDADDDGITDADIKAWAKNQIALSGGLYVTPEPAEGGTNG